jgi:pimeloyl-ACP methyl ester carboxylesterase
LVVAGAEDPLRLPDYATEISRRIPSSELLTYEKCGHMPNIEFPERFVKDVVEFSRKNIGRDPSLDEPEIAYANRPHP